MPEGGSGVAAGDDQWHARVDAGHASGAAGAVEQRRAGRGHGQVGDHRRTDPAVDPLHRFVEPVFALDQLAPAGAQHGEPAEEARVDRAVDADRVDADVADQRRELGQDLVFVADLAVGDQHEDAVARRGPVAQEPQARTQRREQLGAAAGVGAGQVLDRAEPVPVARRHQPRAEVGRVFDPVVERRHREPVVGRQRVDHAGRGAAGRHHLPAAHAAGTVEQEDHVLRTRRRGGLGRQHDDLVGAFVALGVGDADRGLGGAGVCQAQDEVTVGALTGLDAEVAALVDEGVQAGPHLPQLEPGRVDVDADREPDRVREAGQQDRWGDPGRVGHGVGVERVPGADRRAGQRLTGDVARRHHQREPERGRAVLVGQRTDQPELHGDPLAGQDVADPHREDVGPLLLGDRGALAGGDRTVVGLPRLGPLAQVGLDGAAVGRHRHAGHGGAVGQREDVGGFERGLVDVDELGRQHRAADQAGDRGPDVEPVERQVAALGAQGAEAGVGERVEPVELGGTHRGNGHRHRALPSSACAVGLGCPEVSRPRAARRSSRGAAAAAMSA